MSRELGSGERRSASEQRQLEAAVHELFERRISFNRFLGFRVSQLSTRVCIDFDMRPELVGHFLHGRLHGGVISSVLDAAGALAVMWAIAEARPAASTRAILQRFTHLGTVDLRVDYLRPGIGGRFQASAAVQRLGRRIAATSMRLENEQGLLIATANAVYVVS